jgi:lipopolysaccharide/colanic/teichoic acid biosynthesis glycosyltransferase
MSLVGPRMISPPELEQYGEHAGELLSVRPGITGLWQVSGRSDLDRGDRVRLDLVYVKTRSLGLDLRLLLRTLPAVTRGRGAY